MTKTILHRIFDEEKVKKNFSRASVTYDWWAKATESKAAERVLEFADIRGGEAVLEVGVGTGLLFKQLLERNDSGYTVGIDLSPDMINIAKKRMRAFDDKLYSLEQCSVYDLPFKNHRFDCLISSYMLDLLPAEDFSYFLKNFYDLLKPSGKIVLTSMTFGWKWYHHLWERLPALFPELLTQCRPVDLTSFVENAGFRISEEEYISQNTFPSQVLLAEK